MFSKDRVKQYVFWAMVIDAPFIYISAVTLDNAAATIASLVVMGAASALAIWSH